MPDTHTGRLGWDWFFDPGVAGSGESTVPFFGVAQALATQATTVLEVGCGRGGWAELSPDATPLQDLRGPGRTVVGVDIDPVGIENPMIDEFRRIGDDGRWPVDDGGVDLAISDWTLEHIADPHGFVAELERVLRPGGAFLARTVSRHSPLSMMARAIPNERHPRVVSVLQPGRDAQDVFPTEYRMNSDRALGDLLGDTFDLVVVHRSDLAEYFRRWPRAARAVAACEPHAPKALRSTLIVHARKR